MSRMRSRIFAGVFLQTPAFFCPSCHQKRVVEFGECLCEEVLRAVPHRHFVLSMPKILRRYFLNNRKLLSDLSRCGWKSLKESFKETVSENGGVPGAAIAMQTFGDFLGFNPHLHVLCTDGCFYGNPGGTANSRQRSRCRLSLRNPAVAGYHRLSLWVNKMALFSYYQDATRSEFKKSIKNARIAYIRIFYAWFDILFMQQRDHNAPSLQVVSNPPRVL